MRLARTGQGELEDAYVNFVYQPLRDAQGNVEGILVFGLDITEPVRARAARRRWRRRSVPGARSSCAR